MKKTPILHHTITGSGPTVVLLHGFLASSVYWQKVADELSQTHRVIAVDLLGFGHSPKPTLSRYDYDAQLKSLDRTLDAIGINEPFILIGHSMGSLISLRYATMFPRKVTKLLLTNMPVFTSGRQAKQEILGTNIMYKVGLRPSTHWMVWPLFRLANNLRLLPEGDTVRDPARLTYLYQSTIVSRLRSMSNIIYAASIEADLKALTMKTTLLSGLDDRARYLQNLGSYTYGSNIQLATIASGHHIPLTHPQLIAEHARS